MIDTPYHVIRIDLNSGVGKRFKPMPWKQARTITINANRIAKNCDSPNWYVMFNPATNEVEIPVE